jgi:hypothetical protein
VLNNQTKGYKNHPQLERFKLAKTAAVERIDTYLHVVVDEAERRGYKYDRTKLGLRGDLECIEVSIGQLAYEFEHLRKKLLQRTGTAPMVDSIPHHPMFVVVTGPVATWEKTT